MRIGIIRTRWNAEHVDSLTKACKTALTDDCKVDEDNIFETSVPGSFELPMAARFLALSGTVDAIVCIGVLIKGETMHFEYISDAVVCTMVRPQTISSSSPLPIASSFLPQTKGLMNIGIQTSTPVILGVLTCLNEEQVKARSSGSNNHGSDWGKTAVEMALLRTEAMGGKAADAPLKELGFGLTKGDKDGDKKKDKTKQPGFF